MDNIDNYRLSQKIRKEFDKIGYFAQSIFCDTSQSPNNKAHIGFREDYLAYAFIKNIEYINLPFDNFSCEPSKLFSLFIEKYKDQLEEQAKQVPKKLNFTIKYEQ
jgi:hypothetical protein